MLNNSLWPAQGPVVKGLEEFEVNIATNQPEYHPLRALMSADSTKRVLTRWSPTDEQRLAIARGEDIFLEQMTWGNALQPVRLSVAEEPGAFIVGVGYHLAQSPTAKKAAHPLCTVNLGCVAGMGKVSG